MPADGTGPVPGQGEPSVLLLDDRDREVGFQGLLHADGAGAGPPAAVRGRERLVEVDVEDVDAHVSRTDDAGQGVHVGAVHIEQAPLGMDDLGDPADIRLEDAERIGVGDHQGGHVLVHDAGQVLEIDGPLLVRLDLFDRVAAEVGARRVRPMSRVGDEDVLAGVSPRLEGGPDEHHARELAVGAGRRLEGERIHPGDLAEEPFDLLEEAEVPLDELLGGVGVGADEARERRQPLIDLRVVFHRAGAQGVES